MSNVDQTMVSKPLMCVIQMLSMIQTLAWGRRMTSTLYHFVISVTGQVMGHNILYPNEDFGRRLGLVDMLWLWYYETTGNKEIMMGLGSLQENNMDKEIASDLNLTRVVIGESITYYNPRGKNMISRLAIATMCLIVGTTGCVIGIAHLMSL